MKNRIILHIDMDCFFAQVEERENPQFRGKPVVVGADPKQGRGRGVVSTANYIARAFGIHSALPISKAWQLCPEAIFLPPNIALYQQTSQRIMDIIRSYAPKIEQTSLDEAYADIHFTGTYAKAQKLAKNIRSDILIQEKLTCSCGIGPNKMIAKIACESAKPRPGNKQTSGIHVVPEEHAETFIESMEITALPSIGTKTAAILRTSEFRTVGDLKRLQKHDMEELFGSRGKTMYARVRGIDNTPIELQQETKSIGKETTFVQDTRDPELLIQTFHALCMSVVKDLQHQHMSYKTITVVCRFSNFRTHTKSKTFATPHSNTAVFRREAVKLFLQFVVATSKPIRLIGVRAKIAGVPNICYTSPVL